jgi:hypothetical protein
VALPEIGLSETSWRKVGACVAYGANLWCKVALAFQKVDSQRQTRIQYVKRHQPIFDVRVRPEFRQSAAVCINFMDRVRKCTRRITMEES